MEKIWQYIKSHKLVVILGLLIIFLLFDKGREIVQNIKANKEIKRLERKSLDLELVQKKLSINSKDLEKKIIDYQVELKSKDYQRLKVLIKKIPELREVIRDTLYSTKTVIDTLIIQRDEYYTIANYYQEELNKCISSDSLKSMVIDSYIEKDTLIENRFANYIKIIEIKDKEIEVLKAKPKKKGKLLIGIAIGAVIGFLVAK